jgi:hypothetical protein
MELPVGNEVPCSILPVDMFQGSQKLFTYSAKAMGHGRSVIGILSRQDLQGLDGLFVCAGRPRCEGVSATAREWIMANWDGYLIRIDPDCQQGPSAGVRRGWLAPL